MIFFKTSNILTIATLVSTVFATQDSQQSSDEPNPCYISRGFQSIILKHHSPEPNPSPLHPAPPLSYCSISPGLVGQCRFALHGHDIGKLDFRLAYDKAGIFGIEAPRVEMFSHPDNYYYKGNMLASLYRIAEICRIPKRLICMNGIEYDAARRLRVGWVDKKRYRVCIDQNSMSEKISEYIGSTKIEAVMSQ